MVRKLDPSKRRLPVVGGTTATVGAGSQPEGEEPRKATQRVVGIDLGTTNCCLAACSDGRITILDIDECRCMPSVVGFRPETYDIGVEAKRSLHLNPANTIYDAKRLIGREYEEAKVQEDIAKMNWPFKVVKNDRGAPVYSVQSLGVQTTVAPEQVAQLLLGKMKDVAEAFFGGPLDGAVITVPAYFSDAQRQATKNAARTAKIKVMDMGIINEPTAAGLAYSKQLYTGSSPSNILIFDLGGGTFDVSMITITGSVIDVKATDGDNHLGGEDFNNLVSQYFLKQIEERYSVDLRDPKHYKEDDARWDTPEGLFAAAQRALLRLRGASEKIKVALSNKEQETIKLDFLWPGQTRFTAILDRADFEEMNCPLFQQIKSMLADIFGQEKICDAIDPDETVAWGAGVHAASLAGLADAVLLDVTNHPLGVAVRGDVLSIIAPRFQRVGTSKARKYTTSSTNQTTMTFVVYEGDNPRASANKLLDTFTLNGIPALPEGKASVMVTFKVNFDGTLSATAEDLTEGAPGNNKVRKSLIVSSAREQNQIKEQEDMEAQAAELAASKQQRPDRAQPHVQYPAIFAQ